MPGDIRGRSIKAGSRNAAKFDLRAQADGTITQYDIVKQSGVQGEFMKVNRADGTVLLDSRQRLYLAKGGASSGQELLVTELGVIQDLDTSGATVGDRVYLVAAGAPSLTPTGFRRRIGIVTVVGASGTGQVAFDGRMPTGSNITGATATVLSGQTSITVTAATLGGSFGGSPVVATMNEQDADEFVIHARWSTHDLII